VLSTVPTNQRRRGDGGSVLLLMPAALLIVLLLGAIAVDLTNVQLRQRQAMAAAASAANDAVTIGLDQDALRRGEGYHLDHERVVRTVLESLDDHDLTDDLTEAPRVEVTGPDTVTVSIRLRADYVFARSLPGAPSGTQVRGTATATAAMAGG
jgi:hypothetical protein